MTGPGPHSDHVSAPGHRDAASRRDPASLSHEGLGPLELEERYRAYRRRQALALVHLVPRAAIRPLVRAARAAGFEPEEDPLDMLVSYAETLLPLPPFQVWAEDLALHPDEHLRDLDASPAPPTAAAPSPVEARSFSFAGGRWIARLDLFRDASAWRGLIAFEEGATGHVHRTATIFSEDDPALLRKRFLGFKNTSLKAFLRSALP